MSNWTAAGESKLLSTAASQITSCLEGMTEQHSMHVSHVTLTMFRLKVLDAKALGDPGLLGTAAISLADAQLQPNAGPRDMWLPLKVRLDSNYHRPLSMPEKPACIVCGTGRRPRGQWVVERGRKFIVDGRTGCVSAG